MASSLFLREIVTCLSCSLTVSGRKNKTFLFFFFCLVFSHIAVCEHVCNISSLQNAIVSFKELCGLSAVANLKQCILALSPRLTGPDNSPLMVFNLNDQYPNLEPQGLLPEVLKKVTSTYEMVSSDIKVFF